MSTFEIRVPCSSANLGPGFDALGIALPIYLFLRVTIRSQASSARPFNCVLSYSYKGDDAKDAEDAESVSLDPKVNLITRVALYVLGSHGQRAFPVETHIEIVNKIPLGRGLGSSAAAVTAGAVLANEVGRLGLDKARILDYCLMIERHPDNIAAALRGGFVGCFVVNPEPEDFAQIDKFWDQVLPSSAMELDWSPKAGGPPTGMGRCINYPWAKEIKAVVVIPKKYVVPTSKAREILPEMYPSADVAFTTGRMAVLPFALGQSPPDPDMIYSAMQDRIHQPYRKSLIPGLIEVLNSMNPGTQPGLLGICLSGAGPAILALATANFTDIGRRIVEKLEAHDVLSRFEVLELDQEGATVTAKNGA